MGRKSHYNEIIDLVKKEPMTQREIAKALKMTIPGARLNLDRGVENRVIAYLGNKVNKKDEKILLREHYGKEWVDDAHQSYIFTPMGEEFYKRLIKKFPVKDASIKEIVRLYQVIEVMSIFLDMWSYKFKIVKAETKAKGQILTDEEIEAKIIRTKKKVDDFYKDKNKNGLYLDILGFNPIMYWCAFKSSKLDKDREYDPKTDLVENITIPMLNKLRELFLIESKNSNLKIESSNIQNSNIQNTTINDIK